MFKTISDSLPRPIAKGKNRHKAATFDELRRQRAETLERVLRSLLVGWPEYDVPTFAACLRECADEIDPLSEYSSKRSKFRLPGLPTFNVEVVGTWAGRAGEPDGSHVAFECPRCGQVNRHGGIKDEPGAKDGYRVAHCSCWPGGYNIRETAGDRRA